MMPGTTFLPKAGPVGTVIGLIIGAFVMFIIGVNYNFLINKYPDAGGTLTYTIKIFGYDHGFMSSWFLILVYVAIIWANATALGLISRNLLGGMFQFGFHYEVLGYDVYFGEVLLSLVAIAICGLLGTLGKRITVHLQVIFALFLIGGIIIVILCAFFNGGLNISNSFTPMFSKSDDIGVSSIRQISTIVALSPWAFVGFESVSNSAEGFNFSPQKTIWIFAIALLTGTVAYVALVALAVLYIPEGYGNWYEYVGSLDKMDGIMGLPTFYGAYKAMGQAGVVILGVAAFSGIMTGLIGNFIAASRLLYAMADDGILPKWFGKLNKDKSPKNAMLFLTLISLVIPFFGRSAIGWIVDVNTVGATIAYAYTSACALRLAYKENNDYIKGAAGIGLVMSLVFFIYFMSWSADAMSTESYMILAFWSILGFIYFRIVFSHDEKKRFGKSTIVWISLLFLIFFTSLMWMKNSTDEITEEMVQNISDYYEKSTGFTDRSIVRETEEYISEQLKRADDQITRNSFIQMLLIIAALAIMFSLYSMMTAREKKTEAERVKALEQSRAKTIFLSNMSHDIRTPMNAIIGYINLAEREDVTFEELKEYLGKIKGSSHHLLALINDVLEMSRIESGKMDIEPIPMNLHSTFAEIKDMFKTQMDEKHIDFIVDSSNIRNTCVYCDKNRLNRVLLNLISNAYKFTPDGGTVEVKAWEIDCSEEGYGIFEIRVKDSGIGMSKEFASNVFDAFEREKTSTVSGIQGTGLGMSITKSIVDLMGGDITVNTAKGVGTEFVVSIKLQLQEQQTDAEEADESSEEKAGAGQILVDYSKVRILLADDMQINREIATKLLTRLGFMVEQAVDGKDALDKVASSEPGYYNLVLMDVQMPVMGGYEATENIRKLDNPELAGIPILAMTANAFSEDVKKAKEAGMNGHIAKPIDMKQMVDTITGVLTK